MPKREETKAATGLSTPSIIRIEKEMTVTKNMWIKQCEASTIFQGDPSLGTLASAM